MSQDMEQRAEPQPLRPVRRRSSVKRKPISLELPTVDYSESQSSIPINDFCHSGAIASSTQLPCIPIPVLPPTHATDLERVTSSTTPSMKSFTLDAFNLSAMFPKTSNLFSVSSKPIISTLTRSTFARSIARRIDDPESDTTPSPPEKEYIEGCPVYDHAMFRLMIALGVCVLTFVPKVYEAFLVESLALRIDAFRTLANFMGFVVSLLAIQISSIPAGQGKKYRYTWGYGRAEVLGAIVAIGVSIMVSFVAVMESARGIMMERWDGIDFKSKVSSIAGSAGMSLLMAMLLGHKKSWIWWRMKTPKFCDIHPSGPGSDSTDDEEWTKHGCNVRAYTLRAMFRVMLADFIFTLIVLAGTIGAYFRPSLHFIDPLSSLVGTLAAVAIVAGFGIKLMHQCMDSVPPSIDANKLEQSIAQIHGVHNLHDLRIWGLSDGTVALCASLEISPKTAVNDVIAEGKMLAERCGIGWSTIQVRYA